MRVFLSWSGAKSRSVALALKKWLKQVLPALEVWMSDEDLPIAARWATAIAEELQNSNACIICLTPENLNSAWLNFEAGAISKTITSSFVCPLLIGIERKDFTGPISQFQGVVAERWDMEKLVNTLNNASISPLERTKLSELFDISWPFMDNALKKIQSESNEGYEAIRSGVTRLIHSSSIPMYFIDCNFIVQDCNEEFASLVNSSVDLILGKHVRSLIQLFADCVPESRRQAFIERQAKLADMIASNRGPHLEDDEYIDATNIPGGRYRGLLHVRIHADKIIDERSRGVIGFFIVCHIVNVEKLPIDTQS